MNYFRRFENARSRLLVVLLSVLLGQSLIGSYVSASMMGLSVDASIQSANCHDASSSYNSHDSHDASSVDDNEQSKQLSNTESCCNGDCSMMNCHVTSAVLSSLSLPNVFLPSSQNSFSSPLSLVKRSNSLFRPPILG